MNPDASPLLAEISPSLPPALIQVAGFDPLRDEGIAYGKKLKKAGLSVDVRCYDGLIHGFLRFSGMVDAAKAALDEAAQALRANFYS